MTVHDREIHSLRLAPRELRFEPLVRLPILRENDEA
jgi:hypothetical protein